MRTLVACLAVLGLLAIAPPTPAWPDPSPSGPASPGRAPSAAAQEEAFAKATPLRKIATPDDVAQAVIALLENDIVTGQDLVIDGGKNVLYQPLF